MDSKKREVDTTESNPLAFIPLEVWKFAIVAICLFVLVCVFVVGYFNHSSMNSFIGAEVNTFLILLKIAGILTVLYAVYAIAYHIYKLIHTGILEKHERKSIGLRVERQELQNEQLRQQIEVTKQLPAILKYAMEQGHNVEVSPKLEVKVTNFLSNVHTLGNGQAGQQLLTEATGYMPEPYTFSD